MANEVAKKETFSGMLTAELSEVKGSLPKDFNIERFVHNVVALLNENKQLAEFAQKYGTAQIKQGCLRAAYLGLDFMNKEAYLIPYGSTLNFTIDYRGSEKLAKIYSVRPVKEIYGKIVREGDEFIETIKDGEPSISFTPKPFNNSAIIGAFAVCLFHDGGMMYDTMNMEELETSRKHSKASNSGAWKDFPWEMYKKTVIRRLCKNIEMEYDNATQLSIINEDDAIETDAQEIAKVEIAENANSTPFEAIEDADVAPVE